MTRNDSIKYFSSIKSIHSDSINDLHNSIEEFKIDVKPLEGITINDNLMESQSTIKVQINKLQPS